MEKSELELMSVDNLRKEASKLKIKNYVKLPKPELIERIISEFNKSTSDEVKTETPSKEDVPVEEITKEVFESKPFSLEDGSEVDFTDYVGEEHTGIILKKDGIKYKIKAQDDNVVYTVTPGKIKGYIEPADNEDTGSNIVYTDKLNKKLTIGQRCNSRINGSWKEGVIIDFKQISNEDYVNVKLDGNSLSKLVSCADIIGLSSEKAGKLEGDFVKEETIKTLKAKESKIPSKKDGVSLSDQIREALIKGEEKPSEIAKRLSCRPQFVHNIKVKMK